jgi:glutamyl-Q tRNA(Asp) synthetase
MSAPQSASRYVGRFAPSPTGPLHFGSLLAALASFLDAKHHDGRWLLRIEDLDTHRNQPGAEELILASLLAHGLHWDGEPIWQSHRLIHYKNALTRLSAAGLTFFCTCSRKTLRGLGAYPGTCRGCTTPPPEDHAIRLLVPDQKTIHFVDLIQGACEQHLRRRVGDFVIRRRDGIFAYQLTVVVDDIAQGISRVVRGADLLDNTPRQLLLFDYLNSPRPEFAHVPVINERRGHKLSKQTAAQQVDDSHASTNLVAALDLLGQGPPANLVTAPVDTVLDWAVAHYHPSSLPTGASLDGFVSI